MAAARLLTAASALQMHANEAKTGAAIAESVAALLRLLRDHERDGNGCGSCIDYAHRVADAVLGDQP
jgi:hypothetical protein